MWITRYELLQDSTNYMFNKKSPFEIPSGGQYIHSMYQGMSEVCPGGQNSISRCFQYVSKYGVTVTPTLAFPVNL